MNNETLEVLSKLKATFSNYEETCMVEGIESRDAVGCQKKAAEIIKRVGLGGYTVSDLDYISEFELGKSPFFSAFYAEAKNQTLLSAYL